MNLKTKTNEPTPSVDWVTLLKQYKSYIWAGVFLLIGNITGATMEDITGLLPVDPRVDAVVEQQDELLNNDSLLQAQIDDINSRVILLEKDTTTDNNSVTIE